MVMTDSSTGSEATFLLDVEFIDNPCVGSWTGIPNNGDWVFSVAQGASPLTIGLVGINYG